MPKHKPIRFQDPDISDEMRELVRRWARQHPVVSSVLKTVLATAIIGGVLTTAVAAPGIMSAFGMHRARRNREKREQYKRLWARFHDLRKREVFELVKESANGELIYRFSDRGRMVVQSFIVDLLELPRPKKWDGKWRVVVFDIPEKCKKQRRFFQNKLKELGFYPLQKSVFIHPFPCKHEIEILKDFLRIKQYVEIFVSHEVTNGKVLYYFRSLLSDTI